MREPPKLTDALIRAALDLHYGLYVAGLTFLPIGNDSASFVYRAESADRRSYFVKLRKDMNFRAASLVVPRLLADLGIPHVVAPLRSKSDELWVRVGDFAVSLYPFIDARTAADLGLSDQHWRALGATLRRLHSTRLPADVARHIPSETCIPSRRDVLTTLNDLIVSGTFDDPAQHQLAEFWRSRHQQIRVLASCADRLGDELRRRSMPLSLCHADVHTWNVLVDTSEQMWIVDWDETVLAPKERDLMFVVGGIGRDLVSPHQTTCVLEGYGDSAISPDALAYYRYAWAVQDIAEYGAQVFLAPGLGDATRHDAVSGFIDLFAPGNIVDIATESRSGQP